MKDDNMAVSISVASGKGGVGKTSIAVNLALSLAILGNRVALLDADFGLANSHLLLGCKPIKTIKDTITGSSNLNESITEGPKGLKLISGGNGLIELLNLNKSTRYNLIRSFDPLAEKCDVFFIDTPAGASDSTLSFLTASEKVVIILVGEPTSFMDAYTLVKAASIEGNVKEFSVIVNMAESSNHSKEVFSKFKATVMRFLDVNVKYIGFLPYSIRLKNSIVKRKPLVINDLNSKETGLFKLMSKELLKSPNNLPSGISFFNKNSI